MKLSVYAKKIGVTRQTAYRWYRNGQIPGAYQLETGTIIVPDSIFKDEKKLKTIIYSRVSSSKQKDDLKRQSERLHDFAVKNGFRIDRSESEIASGMDENRPKLNSILEIKAPIRLIVENKDRLTMFGFHYIEQLIKNNGGEIIVVTPSVDEEDLMTDFIAFVTSFCARIYGQRRGKRKADFIKEELKRVE